MYAIKACVIITREKLARDKDGCHYKEVNTITRPVPWFCIDNTEDLDQAKKGAIEVLKAAVGPITWLSGDGHITVAYEITNTQKVPDPELESLLAEEEEIERPVVDGVYAGVYAGMELDYRVTRADHERVYLYNADTGNWSVSLSRFDEMIRNGTLKKKGI